MKAVEGDRAYNIEYTIKRSEDDQRHLLSTVAIGYNGRYRVCLKSNHFTDACTSSVHLPMAVAWEF